MVRYYVHVGRNPGVYNTWAECKSQIDGYPGAKFEKYKDAVVPYPAIYVDAACSKPPGPTEYRGILVDEAGVKSEIIRSRIFPHSTNNVGEFLAIVAALEYCKTNNLDIPIYSDSQTGIKWMTNGNPRTTCSTLDPWSKEALVNAVKNLSSNPYKKNVKKWDTAHLGEIPADFGRK